jgi:hypothetical protein
MLQECKNEVFAAKAVLLHSSIRFFRQPLRGYDKPGCDKVKFLFDERRCYQVKVWEFLLKLNSCS